MDRNKHTYDSTSVIVDFIKEDIEVGRNISDWAPVRRKGQDGQPFLPGSNRHWRESPMVDSHRSHDQPQLVTGVVTRGPSASSWEKLRKWSANSKFVMKICYFVAVLNKMTIFIIHIWKRYPRCLETLACLYTINGYIPLFNIVKNQIAICICPKKRGDSN